MIDFLTNALGLYVTFQTSGVNQQVDIVSVKDYVEFKTEQVLNRIDNFFGKR